MESWELKVKLESPNMFNHQDVEVTSVNWEDQDAAAGLTRLLVSYRWHGIVYAIKPLQKFHHIFTYCLCQMLGRDEDDSSLATGHGGMVSAKRCFISESVHY